MGQAAPSFTRRWQEAAVCWEIPAVSPRNATGTSAWLSSFRASRSKVARDTNPESGELQRPCLQDRPPGVSLVHKTVQYLAFCYSIPYHCTVLQCHFHTTSCWRPGCTPMSFRVAANQ